MIARHLVALAAWLGPVSLAVLHGALVAGIFAGNATAISTAAYLENWPVAEFVSLIVTPYIMQVTARDHEVPRWARILWLPLTLLVMGGIGGAFRLLQATWVYIIARVPTIWAARQTSLEASAGCFRSVVSGLALALLAAVFLDRPFEGPIGRSLSPYHRDLANLMALGAAYFAVVAIIDHYVHRELVRQTREARG